MSKEVGAGGRLDIFLDFALTSLKRLVDTHLRNGNEMSHNLRKLSWPAQAAPLSSPGINTKIYFNHRKMRTKGFLDNMTLSLAKLWPYQSLFDSILHVTKPIGTFVSSV